MRSKRSLPIIVVLGAIFLGATLPAGADTRWRAAWANDTFAGTDNQFTNGVALQAHSALADSLAETGGTPAFGKSLVGWLLPERHGLRYRESWTLGHTMQTPEQLQVEELILDDVPYAGMLAWANSFLALDDRELTGVGTLLGWVGDATLAGPIQTTVHELSGATEPEGWDNQLANEPVLNLYAVYKRKFIRREFFDAALSIDAGLGNAVTYGQAGLELRFGDRPQGFALAPTRVAADFDYDGRIPTGDPEHVYLTVAARATGFVHTIHRDGNLLRSDAWTDRNVIEPEDILGQVAIGLHYERPTWGLHFHAVLSTDTTDVPGGPGLEDPRNHFAVLSLEWVPGGR
ncbi:lipid A deacylase LpxR family protein [Wenzhouxiangella sp. XN79A]|uniref:lipid A deacylase LpxR family protein n=1 Tax=Wenzhouxiangella sp. XN79A TaxID=2724193 RepID=UPI00144A837C|nr:lipid A deacylase LpxR family protein [Wenzhouxiangella sp. XN79A]NKI33862.1 lipid A deacylase LpxR family protein [Wenzhouxiangella sp. XN79A]